MEASHSNAPMDQDLPSSPPHFLIRCPDDILRLIFEATVNCHPPEVNLEAATRLATVCGAWRIVALSTPRIWSRISLDMGADREALKDYWARTVERVGKVPTTIHVYNLCSYQPMDLSAMIYEACLTVDSLHLNFKRPPDVGRFAEIWGGAPIAVRNLTISPQKQKRHSAESLDTFGWEPEAIDCGWFLEAFQFPHSLSVKGWDSEFTFMAPTTRGDVRCVQLHLRKMGRLDSEHLLREFPSMEYLSLSKCSFQTPFPNTTAPMLRSLHIKQCINAQDLMAVTFPRLESFSYRGFHRPLLSFLERHQKITDLSLTGHVLQDVGFEQLIRCTTQLRSLSLTVHWALELVNDYVFPSLTSLTIVDDSTLRPTEFDSLLKARFLPRSHPHSTAKSALHVIDELFFDMDQFHYTCINGSLLKGNCFAEATKEVQRDPDGLRVLIRLSWPTCPPGPLEGSMAQDETSTDLSKAQEWTGE